jgi:4-azaleucine resistance transporter AzlC
MSMDRPNPYGTKSWEDARTGLRDIAPAAIACVPIGMLFGAVAVAKGLSPAEATLMSVLVFAGGAQFAAIETWIYPIPIAALAFGTLLINARHVLMGASLSPKMQATRLQKLVAFFVLTDESWALAERRALDRPITFSYWLATAAMLPLAWIGSTTLGAVLGSFLGDPSRFGADFAFTALFIGLIVGFGRSRVTVITVAASAIVAALVHTFIGAPWHVASGALAGIVAAYCAAPRTEAA